MNLRGWSDKGWRRRWAETFSPSFPVTRYISRTLCFFSEELQEWQCHLFWYQLELEQYYLFLGVLTYNFPQDFLSLTWTEFAPRTSSDHQNEDYFQYLDFSQCVAQRLISPASSWAWCLTRLWPWQGETEIFFPSGASSLISLSTSWQAQSTTAL